MIVGNHQTASLGNKLPASPNLCRVALAFGAGQGQVAAVLEPWMPDIFSRRCAVYYGESEVLIVTSICLSPWITEMLQPSGIRPPGELAVRSLRAETAAPPHMLPYR